MTPLIFERTRHAARLVLPWLAAFALCIGGSASARAGDDLTLGASAPPIALTALDGRHYGLDALRGKVVILTFWATWCAPCRMVAPILDQLASEYNGKAKVAKLDVDSNPKTAMKYTVRSIPTILFFKDGKLVDTVVGAVPRPTLESKFKQHAASAA